MNALNTVEIDESLIDMNLALAENRVKRYVSMRHGYPGVLFAVATDAALVEMKEASEQKINIDSAYMWIVNRLGEKMEPSFPMAISIQFQDIGELSLEDRKQIMDFNAVTRLKGFLACVGADNIEYSVKARYDIATKTLDQSDALTVVLGAGLHTMDELVEAREALVADVNSVMREVGRATLGLRSVVDIDATAINIATKYAEGKYRQMLKEDIVIALNNLVEATIAQSSDSDVYLDVVKVTEDLISKHYERCASEPRNVSWNPLTEPHPVTNIQCNRFVFIDESNGNSYELPSIADITPLKADHIVEGNNMVSAAEELKAVPVGDIAKILNEVMEAAVANGANSISMPDEYVSVAHFLSYPEQYGLSKARVDKANSSEALLEP